MRLGVSVDFEKAAPDGRYVRGWASVVSVDGVSVEDTQGDVIAMEELRRAAHRFVTDQRVAKAMHAGEAVGEVVESLVVDDDLARALGIADTKRGWFIAMKIHDDAVAKQVRENRLRAFSIGGKGKRHKMAAGG